MTFEYIFKSEDPKVSVKNEGLNKEFNKVTNDRLENAKSVLKQLQSYKEKFSGKMLEDEERVIISGISCYENFIKQMSTPMSPDEGIIGFIKRLTTAIYPTGQFHDQLGKITARVENDKNKWKELGHILEKNNDFFTYILKMKLLFKDWVKINQDDDIKKISAIFKTLTIALNKNLEAAVAWDIIDRNNDPQAIDDQLDRAKNIQSAMTATTLKEIFKQPKDRYRVSPKLLNDLDFRDNATFVYKLSRKMQALKDKEQELNARGEKHAAENMGKLYSTLYNNVEKLIEGELKGKEFKKIWRQAIADSKAEIKSTSGLTAFLDDLFFATIGVTLFHDAPKVDKTVAQVFKSFTSEVIGRKSDEILDDLEEYVIDPNLDDHKNFNRFNKETISTEANATQMLESAIRVITLKGILKKPEIKNNLNPDLLKDMEFLDNVKFVYNLSLKLQTIKVKEQQFKDRGEDEAADNMGKLYVTLCGSVEKLIEGKLDGKECRENWAKAIKELEGPILEKSGFVAFLKDLHSAITDLFQDAPKTNKTFAQAFKTLKTEVLQRDAEGLLYDLDEYSDDKPKSP